MTDKTPAQDTETANPLGLGSSEGLGMVERLRQMSRRGHWPLLGDEAADEIERAWAARDAAVSDLEAHAAAEVRRAVAAERERWRSAVLVMRGRLLWLDQRADTSEVDALLLGPNVRGNAGPTAAQKED